MSHISRGFFAALAISLTLGAVQLASGRDLAGASGGSLQDPFGVTQASVNRTAKTDRAAVITGAALSRTISFQPGSLPNTSVLVRIPPLSDARDAPAAPSLLRSGDRKATVACEPVVSVLIEVAKLLQPGRCVT